MRALFTTRPTASHFHALVPLARAMERQGHEVAFASGHTFCPLIEEIGFRSFCSGYDRRGVSNFTVFPELRGLSPVEHGIFTEVEIFGKIQSHGMAADLLPILHSFEPAVVVRETFDYGSTVAAERVGIPHAVVEVGAYRTPLMLRHGLAERLDRVREAFGLPPDPNLVALARFLHISLAPPSYQDPSSPLPATAHMFRYAEFNASGPEALPAWVSRLSQQATVYVTLGNQFNRRTDVFVQVLEALRDEPINLIVAVGRDQDPSQFGAQPPNVCIERYIPQTEILPLCSAVVSHGGWSTVMGALTRGIPQVCLPLGADQHENARRCAGLGAGIVVDPEERAPDTIRAALRDVFSEPAYRRSARAIQAEVERLPDISAAVTLLERLAEERRPILRGDAV